MQQPPIHPTQPGADLYGAWALAWPEALPADAARLQVEALNLDATSFADLWSEHDGQARLVGEAVLQLVAERGKLHNPRTGSGGVMRGRLVEAGPLWAGGLPLGAQVAPLPEDLPEAAAVALFDVCAVVPSAQRLAHPGARVAVVGAGGKAGRLALFAAAEAVGPQGQVLAVVPSQAEAERLRAADLPPQVAIAVADARQAHRVLLAAEAAWGQGLADAVLDCAAATGTELASAALTRAGGEVLYFNMGTRFQAAALGAELLGRPLRLGIGGGAAPGAAQAALALVRRHPGARAAFVA